MAGSSPRVALFGVPGDNSNLGVRALLHAAVAQLHARVPGLEPWVFDDGLGTGRVELPLDDGPVTYVRCGARLSRRIHRPESYANMQLARLLGPRVGRPANPAVAALAGAAAVLDASAGDSFTDLYGEKRLRAVLAPKKLALQLRRPLVLLPQTYGPFRSPQARQAAARIVRRARMAWARDRESYELLADLAGDELDPGRHRQGVDMAFLLERHAPGRVPAPLAGWLEERDEGDGREAPLVGVNLSGLLYHQPEGENRFGLTFRYRRVMRHLVERLLTRTDARIVLVDHVLAGAEARYEADPLASADLLARLDPRHRSRVTEVPPGLDACETKWIVARTDWFCGARMHATIGALSSGVPAAAVGYSMKTRAVFETCGIGSEVTEVAGLGDRDVVDRLWDSWRRRDEVRATLARHLPEVTRTAHRQMDEIAALVAPSHTTGRRSA